MLKIAKQLLEDAETNAEFNKSDLLKACLRAMTEDQIYKMAIAERFVDVSEYKGIDYEKSATDRIIDAVLARHGE
jgi:hypothetical protein